MKVVLRFVPGLAGALVGFTALKLLGWLALASQLGVFVAAYLLTTIALDHAMRHYGRD